MSALEDLGYRPFFAEQLDRLQRPDLSPARIAADGRSIYHLVGCRAALGELSGRLRHRIGAVERPAVGDWVAVADSDDRAVIHHVFDRQTVMMRRAAGSETAGQIIAANVDLFFIVTSANRDLNARRLERYLTAVWDSGAAPAIVLNKVDLAEHPDQVDPLIEAIDAVALGAPIIRVSALSGLGLDALRGHLRRGQSFGFVGSSGVGKSSLINRLCGRELQATREIRADGKGRHATTQRELVVLPGGGVLVDTPGMRELGIVEDEGGLAAAFADVTLLGRGCRFRDCRHEGEPGCAVRAAVAAGTLRADRLEGYQKIRREIAAAEARQEPAQAANPKRRWKPISKAVRGLSKIDPKKSG